MAHKEQIRYCEGIRLKFPEYFKNKDVLDCGSLDINGNNRYLFTNCNYTGVDIVDGDNVDIVSMIHEYKPNRGYNTIISTECFEHDKYYKESILNIISLLRRGGLFLFTCATNGRKPHGTISSRPEDSPLTNNYYKNLEKKDILDITDFNSTFKAYSFSTNKDHYDLQFWGIKG